VVAIAIYGFTLIMRISPTKLLETLPQTIYFWLPISGIFLGYGFLGYSVRVLTLYGFSPLVWGFLALAIASVWSLAIGYGGLLATMLALGMVVKFDGVNAGFIAIAVAAGTMWLGFSQTDAETDIQQSPNQKLTLQEIASVLVLLAFATFVNLGTYQVLSGVNAAIVTGAVAGSYAVIGSQVKASGITTREALQLFGTLAFLGLAIGWVYGWFTYKVFVPV